MLILKLTPNAIISRTTRIPYVYVVAVKGKSGKLNREIYSGIDAAKAHEIFNKNA